MIIKQRRIEAASNLYLCVDPLLGPFAAEETAEREEEAGRFVADEPFPLWSNYFPLLCRSVSQLGHLHIKTVEPG